MRRVRYDFASARVEIFSRDSATVTMAVMSYRQQPDTSRRVIDVATGILVGLRGYSQREAFDELVRVVNHTGVGIGSIATGLVALASGQSSAAHAEAFTAWGELFGRRELNPA